MIEMLAYIFILIFNFKNEPKNEKKPVNLKRKMLK